MAALLASYGIFQVLTHSDAVCISPNHHNTVIEPPELIFVPTISQDSGNGASTWSCLSFAGRLNATFKVFLDMPAL